MESYGQGLMKRTILILGMALVLATGYPRAVEAGEPTGKIGPLNPTMFRCVDKNDSRVIIKDNIELAKIQEIVDNDPTTLDSMCTSTTVSDFGFDTTDGAQMNAFLDSLKDECDDEGGRLIKIEDTRIEGFVYEFHPDVQNPGEWFPVPSRDVPVIAQGIDFEVFWGSAEDGSFYFPNGFGAGPIILSLRLPPDAHPVNPNVVINSTGLDETWTVFLGFYRGDTPPQDVTQLKAPNGSFLPFTTLADLEMLSQCGYIDLPEVAEAVLPSIPPPSTLTDTVEMPNVGGILPHQQPTGVILLAVILAVVLPAAGIYRLRQNRAKKNSN